MIKFTNSVAPFVLVVANLILACAEPTAETPARTPVPAPRAHSVTEQVTKEPEPLAPTSPAPVSEPTRASESEYNRDITKATTSQGLTNAGIAWHALNTYAWDCEEVISRESQVGDYFVVTCSNGTKLRVYPRAGQHPRITNSSGGYD